MFQPPSGTGEYKPGNSGLSSRAGSRGANGRWFLGMTARVRRVGNAMSPLPPREARMRRAPLSLIAALLLTATPALAQRPSPAAKPAPAAKQPAKAGKWEPVTSVEGITEYRLPNGLQRGALPGSDQADLHGERHLLRGQQARGLRRGGHGAPARAPALQGHAEAPQHSAGCSPSAAPAPTAPPGWTAPTTSRRCRPRTPTWRGRWPSRRTAWSTASSPRRTWTAR